MSEEEITTPLPNNILTRVETVVLGLVVTEDPHYRKWTCSVPEGMSVFRADILVVDCDKGGEIEEILVATSSLIDTTISAETYNLGNLRDKISCKEEDCICTYVDKVLSQLTMKFPAISIGQLIRFRTNLLVNNITLIGKGLRTY